METVLNQQEIDALVRAARGGAAHAGTEVARWDYHQAGRLGREQLELINSVHEGFARSLSNAVAAYLRSGFRATLVSAEHLSYREFLGGIPEVTYLASCTMPPFKVRGMIHLDLAIAFPLIDLLLGGEGVVQPRPGEMTEIEEQVVESVMRIICRQLQTAWRALPLEFQFEQRQYTSQAQQLMPVEERNLCLSFEVVLNEFRGTMSLAIPAVISGALLRQLSASRPAENSRSGESGSGLRLRQLLLGCRFRVELGFRTTATAGELAALAPGNVLPLSRRIDAGEDLMAHDLKAYDSPIFRAQAARRGNRRAAQIISAIDHNSSGKDRGRT